MGDENLSLYTPYRALFCHRSPSRENTTRSVSHDLGNSALSTCRRLILDPVSTQPQSTAGQQGGKADVTQDSGSFHRLVPDVTMVSRDGRSFLGHVATATSTGIDQTSPQGTSGASASSYPIKGQVRALQGKGQDTSLAKLQQVKAYSPQINISSNLPYTLTFPLRTGLSSLSRSL
jgi:hypothetical protein